MIFDPMKTYAADGVSLRNIARVMTRLFDVTAITPDERRDLANTLCANLSQITVTLDQGL